MKTNDFNKTHPFVLADGRRFSTLACAGHGISENKAHNVRAYFCTDESTGQEYSVGDALRAFRDHSTQEWQKIYEPMKEYIRALKREAA